MTDEYQIRKAKYGHLKKGDWFVAVLPGTVVHLGSGDLIPTPVTLRVGRISGDYSAILDIGGRYKVEDICVHIPCVRPPTENEIKNAKRDYLEEGDLCYVKDKDVHHWAHRYFSHFSKDGRFMFFIADEPKGPTEEYSFIHKV